VGEGQISFSKASSSQTPTDKALFTEIQSKEKTTGPQSRNWEIKKWILLREINFLNFTTW